MFLRWYVPLRLFALRKILNKIIAQVEHLKVLTTQIAQDYPGNLTLLSDIQATYKWLDEHSEEARQPLLCACHFKLFLNVNDPTEDGWTGKWEAAQNIVLNLHYDCQQLKTAGDFLVKYDKLLLAAGCSTMKIFIRDGCEPPPTLSESDNHRLREVQNEMRKSGELTDMVFVPYSGPSEVAVDEYESGPAMDVESDNDVLGDVAVNPLDLRAHRLVLAAAIPYFRDRANGWKVDNIVDGIRFYGSAFGAKLLLGTLPSPRALGYSV